MKIALRRMLLAFETREFRWLWLASTFGFINMMSYGLAVGWIVLEITDSPFWVGAVTAFRGVGQVGFGIFAGVMIDRYDKRRLLLLVQTLNFVVAIGLGVLIATEVVELWHLLGASLITGVITSIRSPASNTLTFQLVGSKRILNANAALGLGFNVALVLGSSAAGLVIERVSVASGFYFSGVSALLGVGCLWFVTGRFITNTTREPILQAAAAGIRYAWGSLELRRLLALSVVLEIFGFSYNTMLPVVARDVLGVGAAGLGLLSSARGLGAGISNLGVASLGEFEKQGRLIVGAVVGVGLFLMAFGLSPWYVVSIGLLFMLGAMLTAYDVTMKSMILLLAGDKWRGRVQSIYTLTYGLGALSSVWIGGLASAIGVSLALATNGGMILAFIGRNARAVMPLGVGSEELQGAD